MKVPRGIDRIFVTAAGMGDLPMLQQIVKVFKNGEGPGEIPYAKLKTPGGCYALHMAAGEGKHSVCRFLTRVLKLDINATTDCTGETPLHRSIDGKHQPTTSFLIDSGADVMKCNILGETPIHYAASEGSKEIVKILLSKGADLNAISDTGTPLHAAARSGNGDVLKYLLDLKADLNPAIEMSPLFSLLCSRSIDIECMELLLKAGVDPNRSCYMGTPLRYAVFKPDVRIIRRLLKAGANPNIPDIVGQTPLEHAALSGRREVVELLFPVTSRIPCYPDWSICGVMRHAKSSEAEMLFESKLKEIVVLGKAKGREAFRRKKYVDAAIWYSEAAMADPTDVKVLSNRSLCHTKMNMGTKALADAHTCIELEPRWAKAHYREGAAWNVLRDFTKAAEAFSRALALDPDNKEIKMAYMSVLAERNKFSHWDEDLFEFEFEVEVEDED